MSFCKDLSKFLEFLIAFLIVGLEKKEWHLVTGEVPRLYELEFLNFRLNQWNETYFSKVFFCLTQQLPSSAKLNILQIDKIYLERGFDPFFAKNKRKVREIFLLSRKDWWNFLSDSLFLSLQSSVDQGFFCELPSLLFKK